MHGRKIKIGIGIVAALSAAIALFPANAQADYAPAGHDVVGVGSDTLQALGDFVADGSYVGDPGYNTQGNKFKFISIDATADANTRLAYGPAGGTGTGAGGTTGCGPGTGAGIATGNSGVTDTASADLPCVLNPTVVLRAEQSPEQRPNGSGAGYKLLAADTTAAGAPIGNGTTPVWGTVNFSRASSGQNSGNANFDSITVGTDNLATLTAATTHAVAGSLTKANLALIYACTDTNWSQIGGTAGTIVPLLPQVGSGTRKTFLSDIGVTTPGGCVQNVEENDPEAIADSSSPVNAVEPMAQTRLNLFQGISGTGGAAGSSNGYFKDPSCPFSTAISGLTGVAGTGNAPANCQGTAATLAPTVHEWVGDGTASQPYTDDRNLYMYFRDVDIYSNTTWQPGGTQNWVRTMFYNPCTGASANATVFDPTAKTLITSTAGQQAAGCSAFGTTEVGPGGAAWFQSGAGQLTIADAGVQPTWAFNAASV